MNFILTLEKYGINKELKSQVDKYYKEILDNPDKDIFKFEYVIIEPKALGGKIIIKFKLTINTNIAKDNKSSKLQGQYQIKMAFSDKFAPRYFIEIDSRENYDTLFHEVKHLDFFVRRKNSIENPSYNNVYNDIFKKSKDNFKNIKGSNSQKLSFLFYQYDKDEFESKYHGYFSGFEKYLLSKKSENLTRKELFYHFNKYINDHEDQTSKEYLNGDNIDLNEMFSERFINKIFYSYIMNAEYMGKWETKLDIFLEFIVGKEWIKTTLNMYSEKEKGLIDKAINHFEKELNKRKRKYKKKFLRIVTAMFDKYVI